MRRLAVQPLLAADRARAAALAPRLGLSLLAGGQGAADAAGFHALLRVSGDELSLQRTGPGAAGPVAVDFGDARMRHRRRAGNNELLGRAVGVGKKPALCVLDATAGLGRDAFVLADLGCQLLLCERDPLVAELLAAGLARAAAQGDDWLRAVVARMRLYPRDARQLDSVQLAAVDVIYLDPMFSRPGRQAAVKKDMALLQSLLGEVSPREEAELLDWALSQPVARVVVKRAAKAASLAARPPSHCIAGRAVRYDVHVRHGLR